VESIVCRLSGGRPIDELERDSMMLEKARRRAQVWTLFVLGLIAFWTAWVPLASGDATTQGPSPQSDAAMRCQGPFVQGGTALCQAPPGSRIQLGDAGTKADREGVFVVGFDRDSPEMEVALVELPDGRIEEYAFEVEKREYSVSRINGLPPSQVDTYTESELRRIEASSDRKRVGDASRAELSEFRQRFSWPFAGRKTSPFGAQRILNGVEKRPHYGVDLAAPKGTPIRAPAGGVVTLADADLYFEGAMIVIDHGQGYLSKYLHVSRIDVEPGQIVKRGDLIGAVGSRGRSTGPHLCWRLKWRDRNLDPELWVE
jgi:murein DD-endopeptidase MepM/ murein hydrolase activator NlpD